MSRQEKGRLVFGITSFECLKPSKQEREKILQDIKNFHEKQKSSPCVLSEIGRGSFGKILSDGTYCAKLPYNRVDSHLTVEKQLQSILFEAEILRLLSHPNIIRPAQPTSESLFYQSNLSLIMRTYIENLFIYINHQKSSTVHSNIESHTIACQISDGLSYLHKNNIVHTDLKPENILLERSKKNIIYAVIADFGGAIRLLNDFSYDHGNARFTDGYRPPEAEHENKICKKSDVYSLGQVLLDLTTGTMDSDQQKAIISNIAILYKQALERYQSVRSASETVPRKLLLDLISRCKDSSWNLQPSANDAHGQLRNLKPALFSLSPNASQLSRDETKNDMSCSMM